MSRKKRPRRFDPLGQMNRPSPDHAAAIDQMLPQLLIALVKRAGGKLTVPVAEIDDTDNENLAMRLTEDRKFEFTIQRKAGHG